ncbi:MAG: tetratricopeptide repeat protein [Myxococcota bacterium]|jgi:tetratricopeptide (TPR) repeat protein|nr:tetratricopeptide repeat protein [Myxococcota bacterium]
MTRQRLPILSAWTTSLALATLLVSGSVWAQPQWEGEKGDCEKMLTDTKLARRNIAHLTECSDLFLSYRDTTKLTPKERRDYRRGFSVLYYKGDDTGRENASEVLKRLGAKPLEREIVFPDEADAASAVSRVSCQDPPAGDEKKARAFNKQGLEQYRKKKYSAAIGYFEKAMRADPSYLEPIYNAACNYALLKDSRASVELLEELKGRCGRQPRVFLTKAHTDPDFRFIKKDPSWRQTTGYVEILLLNGAGPEGQQDTERVARDLTTSMGRKPAFVGTDRNPRSVPLVYFKPAFKDLAEQVKEIVGSPRTKMKEINFNTAIKQYNFDMIVVWGQPHRSKLKEIPKVQGGGGGGGGGGGEEGALDGVKKGFGAVKDVRGTMDEGVGTMKGATEAPSF